MAYIGSTPTSQNFISGTDYFNGTGSQTAFTLTRSVNSVNDVEVVVNNVIQQPNSYTVSGTTLTLSAAPSSGTSNVYVRYLATNMQSFTVPANSIDYSKLDSNLQSKFAMKNRIINGAMVIDQRNAGASVTPVSGQFLCDRWVFNSSQASKFTAQQNQGSVTPPNGFVNYQGLTVASAVSVGSGDLFILRQRIEGYNWADLGWGTANAKTVTLSFWVRSSLTGTFGGSLANGGEDRSYPFTYTISSANTWEQKSITITGDTSGTWLTTNGCGVELQLGLGVGSTYSGTAGSWASGIYLSATGATSVVGTNGATFYITGVQLEVGSSATGFEYRQYGQELALCQRYYWQNQASNPYTYLSSAITAGSTNGTLFQKTPVTMRTSPTVAVSNVASYGGSSIVGFSTLATNRSSSEMLTIDFTGSGFTPTLTGSAVIANNNASAYISASAEL